MKELLPTLIGLFGTITALSIAFLVLLYESSKRWIDRSKQKLLAEVKNFQGCRINRETGTLEQGMPLFEYLSDEIKHDQINPTHIKELLSLLQTKIVELQNKDIEKIDVEVAGKRAKDAFHLEKYHRSDIEETFLSFTASNSFYDDFPSRTKRSIGVPLLICAILIVIYPFRDNLIVLLGLACFDVIIGLLTLVGLFLVYKFSVNTLIKLKNIDK